MSKVLTQNQKKVRFVAFRATVSLKRLQYTEVLKKSNCKVIIKKKIYIYIYIYIGCLKKVTAFQVDITPEISGLETQARYFWKHRTLVTCLDKKILIKLSFQHEGR